MGMYFYGFYDGLGNLKTLITVNQLQSIKGCNRRVL